MGRRAGRAESVARYVFPGGNLPTLAQTGRAAERRFLVEIVHNFGPDFDRTVMAWHERFEAGFSRLSRFHDETVRRAWPFYLPCCAGALRSRFTQLSQVVRARPGTPRDHLRALEPTGVDSVRRIVTATRRSGRLPGARCVILAFATLTAWGGLEAQSTSPGLGSSPPAEFHIAATWVDLDGDGTGGPGFEFTVVDRGPRLGRPGFHAGLMLSPRGQAYVYGGVHASLPLPWAVRLRPSLAAGLYSRGEGRELGSPLEFRSALAVERSVGEVRMTLYLYHLSNAGLGDLNPGLEGIGLGFVFPISP